MGFYKLKDGKMIELIYDNEGKFIRFGDIGDVSDEEAEKIKEEINEDLRNQNILPQNILP